MKMTDCIFSIGQKPKNLYRNIHIKYISHRSMCPLFLSISKISLKVNACKWGKKCFAQHDSKFSIKFQKGQNQEKPRASQGQKKGLQRAAPTESSTVPIFLCSKFHAKGMYFKLWDNVKKELKNANGS